MRWSPRRRAVVQGVGTLALGGLAGCSALSSQSATLDLTLFNQTETPYTIEITLLKPNENDSRSAARRYSATIDVEAQGAARRNDVATVQPYLIQYELFENNSRLTDEDHIHYYPTDDGNGTLTFDIGSTGELTRR